MSDESRDPGPGDAGTPPPVEQTETIGLESPTEVLDLDTADEDTAHEPAATAPASGEPWFDVPLPGPGGTASAPSRQDGAPWPQKPGVPARADAPWTRPSEAAMDSDAPSTATAATTQPLSAGWPPPQGQPAGAAAAGPAPYGPLPAPTVPLGPADPGQPLGAGPMAAVPAPRRRRSRGPIVAGLAALCLLCAVIGGVAGQLVADRIHVGGSTLPQPGPGATARPTGSIANIVAQTLPSVVTIKVRGGGDGDATGSGFVIDDKGHLLTNNHVVSGAGASGEIDVVLSNGDVEPATIVGRDASYDLAVLRLDRTHLTPLVLGRSDQVVVGDQVIAVGAPLGLDQTVTSGIVSALNRPVTPGAGDDASYINAIQTDAAINPGNSGGPLLDMEGKVIGINSAIARVPGAAAPSSGNIGLGFAIPSDQARRTADQLIATGHATHPIIGVLIDRTYSGVGAQVSTGPDAVTPGGPAERAGIKAGDVIVTFEGQRIRTPDQLIVSIRSRAVGDTVTLTVTRGGQQLDLRMTLQAAPAD